MSRPLNKRTLQSAAAATQDGNSLVVQGVGACALQITGTFSATITFEGTVNEDSSTWVAITGFNRNDGSISSTATAAGIWFFSVAGLHAIRARVSTYASGNVTVVGREVDGILPTSSRSLPNVEGTIGQAIPSKALLVAVKDTVGNLKSLYTAGADGLAPTDVLEVVLAGLNGSNQADRLRVDAQKNLLTGLRSSAGAEPVISTFGNSDTWGTSNNGLLVGAVMGAWGGSNVERWRNNTEGTLLASAARTTTTSSANQTNYNARGVILTLNVTANPGGAETLTFSLRMVDPASGATTNNVALLATVAAQNNVYRLFVYPGASGPVADANVFKAIALPCPRTWIGQVTPSGSGSWTYSLSYQYVV